MLRLVALAAQASVIFLAAYNALTALWGWPNQRPSPTGGRKRKFRVLIPAHNEEGVIGNLLDDLANTTYPQNNITTTVLADRCTDRTVDISKAAGVLVAVRSDGPPGKGAALQWYLESAPLEEETLLILDADNRIDRNLLEQIADAMDDGHCVVQCYLDIANPGGSPLAEASALSYWAGNRMVQLARSNLGWAADLGGTGMAFSSEALNAVGGFSESLTEDQEVGVRLALAGYPTHWLHDARVRDEKPEDIGVVVRQRARWMAGKRATRRKHLAALLKTRSVVTFDLAIRLAQPGRAFVALVSGILTVLSAATGSNWLFPWQVWGTVTAVQVAEPIPFLAREGVEPRRLARYPLLIILAALWIPIRFASSRVSGWYHTPHRGTRT